MSGTTYILRYILLMMGTHDIVWSICAFLSHFTNDGYARHCLLHFGNNSTHDIVCSISLMTYMCDIVDSCPYFIFFLLMIDSHDIVCANFFMTGVHMVL